MLVDASVSSGVNLRVFVQKVTQFDLAPLEGLTLTSAELHFSMSTQAVMMRVLPGCQRQRIQILKQREQSLRPGRIAGELQFSASSDGTIAAFVSRLLPDPASATMAFDFTSPPERSQEPSSVTLALSTGVRFMDGRVLMREASLKATFATLTSPFSIDAHAKWEIEVPSEGVSSAAPMCIHVCHMLESI